MPSLETIPFGAILLDTDTKVTPAMAKALASLVDARGRPVGVGGLVRYLSLGSPLAGDLDAAEVAGIHAAGLAILPCQHVRYPGWNPTGQLGLQDGQTAAANATHAGILAGCSVECDLEEVAPSTSLANVQAYGNQWFAGASPFGPPLLYVGDGALLSAAQLFALAFTDYASSGSIVPAPAHRGFSMWQIPPLNQTLLLPGYGPFKYDLNIVGRDRLGGAPTWQIP